MISKLKASANIMLIGRLKKEYNNGVMLYFHFLNYNQKKHNAALRAMAKTNRKTDKAILDLQTELNSK